MAMFAIYNSNKNIDDYTLVLHDVPNLLFKKTHIDDYMLL